MAQEGGTVAEERLTNEGLGQDIGDVAGGGNGANEERQTDVYWLAHECLRSAGVTVAMFGPEFLDTLVKVEVLDDEPLS